MQTLPSLILSHVIIGYDHRPYQRGAFGFHDSGNRDACVPLLSCLSKCRNPKRTNNMSHLTMPQIKTYHPTFRNFVCQVFVVEEDEGFIPFVFLGAEILKTKSTCAKPYRDFKSREFRTGVYQGLASRYPKCRNTETSRLIHTITILGFRKSGFRDMRKQKVSHLGFLRAETPKPVFIAKFISGFRKSGLRDRRVQGN
jgi:hypothetical protein